MTDQTRFDALLKAISSPNAEKIQQPVDWFNR